MKVDVKMWNVMRDRERWLRAWIGLRNYQVEKEQKDFLLFFYCTLRKIKDKKYALKALYNMNQRFPNPLSNEQLEKKVILIAEQKEIEKKYRNETIIKRLKITPEEVERLEIGLNMKKRKEGEQNSEARHKRNEKIIHEDKSSKELAEKYHLSEQQIKNIKRNHNQNKKSERDKQIIDYYCNWKLSKSEIARWVGCARNTVRTVIENYEKEHQTAQKDKCSYELESKEVKVESLTFVIDGIEEDFSSYMSVVREATIDEHEIALNMLQNSKRNIALLGDAGSGKSYLIKNYISSKTEEQLKRTLIIAPTGTSATQIGGITIHKAFRLPNDVIDNEALYNASEVLKDIDELIIEETSMVRNDIFSYIGRACKHIHDTKGRNIRLIVLGDFAQIPPVVCPSDKEKLKKYYPNAQGSYAFDSEFWEYFDFQEVPLRYVHRQDSPELIDKLRELKCGKISALDWFNDNCSHKEDEKAIYICPTNEMVDYYNEKAISRFDCFATRHYFATYDGDWTEKHYPAPQRLTLAVGARVMTLCNTKDFNNGNLGTVKKLNKKSVRVLLDDGKEVCIKPKVFEMNNGKKYLQLPLSLAFALTSNKIQGKTFKKINVCTGWFAPFQLYVALSRATTLKNIHIIGTLTKDDLIVDKRALKMMIGA